MQRKVAYQGTKASFSEIAIEEFFGDSVDCVGQQTFEDVFASLENEDVDFAALPIENSLIGPIVDNLDLFARSDVTVFGELCLPIEHCLVGKKGQRLEDIKTVYSHPKALEQCTRFFKSHPWAKPVVYFDTAGAAEEVSLQNDLSLAAIGSRKAAELYGLEVLKSHLEDDASNTTRFLFLRKGSLADVHEREGKCSLLFTLEHRPGALASALQVLAESGLNLTQIVSRPIKEKPFEYRFFVDIIFSSEVEMRKVLDTLKQRTYELKVLGLYDPA